MNLFDRKEFVSAMSLYYRMMVASAPLLEFAAARSEGELLAYYKQHLDEEQGHDEMLRLDLMAMGLLHIPHSHQAAQIAGAQYYLIAHFHPCMLLGYMYALERESVPLPEIDALEAHYGVKLTAMRHHSTHDPDHAKDLSRVIQGLDASLQRAVYWNESCTVRAVSYAIYAERF